jgi:hypothetical protein
MLYSKTTNGFYDPVIHGDAIPTDAVEITKEQYDALFEGQAQGKQITADDDGNPILVDGPSGNIAPKPNYEEIISQLTARIAALEAK